MCPKRHESNAYAQIAAQAVMLAKFGASLGVALQPTQLLLDGVTVQIDGYAETGDCIVLAECWAHIGKAKVAQRHKVAADILKLMLAASTLRKRFPSKSVNCYIVFADSAAADVLGGATWIAAAARTHGIVAETVELDAATSDAIRQAQKAQDLRAKAEGAG